MVLSLSVWDVLQIQGCAFKKETKIPKFLWSFFFSAHYPHSQWWNFMRPLLNVPFIYVNDIYINVYIINYQENGIVRMTEFLVWIMLCVIFEILPISIKNEGCSRKKEWGFCSKWSLLNAVPMISSVTKQQDSISFLFNFYLDEKLLKTIFCLFFCKILFFLLNFATRQWQEAAEPISVYNNMNDRNSP